MFLVVVLSNFHLHHTYQFLIDNSKSIIGEEGMTKMVDDQNTILKFIVDINNQMPDTKIQEIQSLINSNN